MAGRKPVAASILSMLGGALILLNGVLLMEVADQLMGAIGSIPGMEDLGVDLEAIFFAIGAVGLVLGAIILLNAIVMLVRPTTTRGLGILALILALVSFVAGGGFVYVGLVLGVEGGILGIIFKPS